MTTDVASALTAKSDQLNADDLIGGPIIIEITQVTNIGKGKEQPLIINYKGDDGKPWKPCKTMGRLMAHAWGTTEGAVWVGRKVQLYRDPTVTFGPNKPGGIRISHMSDIVDSSPVALTTTRSIRKPFTVKPLMGGVSSTDTDRQRDLLVTPPSPIADDFIADMQTVPTLDGLAFKWKEAQRLFKDSTRFADIHAAKEKRKLELTTKEPDNVDTK